MTDTIIASRGSNILLPLYKNPSPATRTSSQSPNLVRRFRGFRGCRSCQPTTNGGTLFQLLPRFARRWLRSTKVRSVIKIHVTHVRQIFNSFDPSPFHERDIDTDAEQFITTMAESMTYDEPVDIFQIHVHVNDLPSEKEYFELFKKRLDTMLRGRDSVMMFEELDKRGNVVVTTTTKPHEFLRESTFRPDSPNTVHHFLPGVVSTGVSDDGQQTGEQAANMSKSLPINLHSLSSAILEDVDPQLAEVQREKDLLDALSDDLKVTLQNHFAFQSQLVRNEVQRMVSTGQSAAFFGLLILIGCLTLSRLVLKISIKDSAFEWTSVFSNALEILAWVCWWKPVEMLIFGWWPLVQRKRTLDKLSLCDLRVFHDATQNEVAIQIPHGFGVGGGAGAGAGAGTGPSASASASITKA